MADNAALVAKYIQLRNKKASLKAEHERTVAQLTDAMERIERYMLDHLTTTGADSVGTAEGTFFKASVTSATVADWDQTLHFIRENDLWHMLDKRVNKTAVLEYMESNKDPETGDRPLPPGVNYREETVVRVRVAA